MNEAMHQEFPDIVTKSVLWRGNAMAKVMQNLRFMVYKVRGMK